MPGATVNHHWAAALTLMTDQPGGLLIAIDDAHDLDQPVGMMVETERRAELGTVRGGRSAFTSSFSDRRSHRVTDERPPLLQGVDEDRRRHPGLSAYFTSGRDRRNRPSTVFAEANLDATVDADPIPGEIRRRV